jgi:hypothetical protein
MFIIYALKTLDFERDGNGALYKFACIDNAHNHITNVMNDTPHALIMFVPA